MPKKDNHDEYMEKVAALEDVARQLGLYMEGSAVIMQDETEQLLAVRFSLGDIAFADRTLNPEADNMERKFGELKAETEKSEYEETKERMRRNVAAGRDPLDDGEDE